MNAYRHLQNTTALGTTPFLIHSKTEPIVQICRKYQSTAATPFSLGALSEFKEKDYNFPAQHIAF